MSITGLPGGCTFRGRALQAAFRKGQAARENGRSIFSVPYADLRTRRGAVTWSRAFRGAWLDGWMDANLRGHGPDGPAGGDR